MKIALFTFDDGGPGSQWYVDTSRVRATVPASCVISAKGKTVKARLHAVALAPGVEPTITLPPSETSPTHEYTPTHINA